MLLQKVDARPEFRRRIKLEVAACKGVEADDLGAVFFEFFGVYDDAQVVINGPQAFVEHPAAVPPVRSLKFEVQSWKTICLAATHAARIRLVGIQLRQLPKPQLRALFGVHKGRTDCNILTLTFQAEDSDGFRIDQCTNVS